MIATHERNTFIAGVLVVTAIVCALIILSEVSPRSYSTLTGMVTQTSVTVLALDEVNCTIPLVEEWNLISVYCFHGALNSTTAFGGLGSSRYFVFAYVSNSNNSWAVDVERVPDTISDLPLYALNDLETVDRMHGYWIYAPAAVNFTYDGYLRPLVEIELEPGWNLIGYPTNLSKNITEALASIDGLYTAVMTYNASAATWLTYVPAGSNNTLTIMEPYFGYWINMTTFATWTVNW